MDNVKLMQTPISAELWRELREQQPHPSQSSPACIGVTSSHRLPPSLRATPGPRPGRGNSGQRRAPFLGLLRRDSPSTDGRSFERTMAPGNDELELPVASTPGWPPSRSSDRKVQNQRRYCDSFLGYKTACPRQFARAWIAGARHRELCQHPHRSASGGPICRRSAATSTCPRPRPGNSSRYTRLRRSSWRSRSPR